MFQPVIGSEGQERSRLIIENDYDCLPVLAFGLAGLRLWKPEDDRLWIATCFGKDDPREDYVTCTINNVGRIAQIDYAANRP